MDPLTALSVAGTIVQFVDFGSKLLSAAQDLYKSTSGSLTVNDEIELITSDLLAVTLKLRPDPKLGHEFQRICDEAARLAQEMLGRLDKLKMGTKGVEGSKNKEMAKREMEIYEAGPCERVVQRRYYCLDG